VRGAPVSVLASALLILYHLKLEFKYGHGGDSKHALSEDLFVTDNRERIKKRE
jgi:hypothetical protein